MRQRQKKIMTAKKKINGRKRSEKQERAEKQSLQLARTIER
jgi:hypothetical protein